MIICLKVLIIVKTSSLIVYIIFLTESSFQKKRLLIQINKFLT